MNSIWIIISESIYEVHNLDVFAFSKEEDARKEFNHLCRSELADIAGVNGEYIIEQDENSITIYEDGDYNNNHINLRLKEVRLNG